MAFSVLVRSAHPKRKANTASNSLKEELTTPEKKFTLLAAKRNEILILEYKDYTLRKVYGPNQKTAVEFKFPTTEQLDADIKAGEQPGATQAENDKARKAGRLKRFEKRIDREKS